MKVSYNWLKEYVSTDLSPQDLGDKLSMVGLVLDSLEPNGDDWVYEFENLANRPDWLSVQGIVREIVAVTGAEWTFPDIMLKESSQLVQDAIKVCIEAPEHCPRYTARVIRNIQVGPSPDWLIDRLEKSGIRAINNIVDITNYVLLEYGHPLHAFDLNKVGNKEVIIRLAKPEPYYTLDGVKRILDEEMLVVADAHKTLAIAGVMGGQDAEVLEDTRHILLESAYFNLHSVRQTSLRLGLSTEASYRFERGADVDMVPLALDRAASLIQELAGGEVLQGVVDAYVAPLDDLVIEGRVSKINRIIGLELSAKEMQKYLQSIDFTVGITDEDTLYVEVPNCRREVYREEDLAEEIARLYGYNYIPTTTPDLAMYHIAVDPLEHLQQQLRETSIRLGLWEAINYSFIHPKEQKELKEGNICLALPLSEEQSVMRQSLVPGLLKNFAHNWAYSLRAGDFFELGDVYGLIDGVRQESPMWGMISPQGVRFVKGCVEQLLQMAGLKGRYAWTVDQSIWSDADRALCLLVDDELCGSLALVSSQKSKQYGIKECKHPISVAELELDLILHKVQLTPVFCLLSAFPAVHRDLVLKMPEEMLCGQVLEAIDALNLEHLQACELFDIYRGEQLGSGQKSLGFALTFQSQEATLTDAEVDQAYQAILDHMQDTLCITLRDK